MTIFDHPNFRGHERVAFIADRASGLRAIIAIHSSALGPAAGGVRCLPYARSAFALGDALQLARAATRRAALADVPLGGGQAVIIADPVIDKTDRLLEAFGRAIAAQGGAYVAAPDLCITPRDMAVVGRATRHVIGLPDDEPDLAQATACGAAHAIRAAVHARLDRSDLAGLRVAVHGLGPVGMPLCGQLSEAGASLLVADPEPAAVLAAVTVFGATAVPLDQIVACPADVLAPCAPGAALNDAAVELVRAPVVCGVASPRLSDAAVRVLHGRGVLVVPDAVAAAGGAIAMAGALLSESEPVTRRKLEGVFELCQRVLALASAGGMPPAEAAERLIQARLRQPGRATVSAFHRAVA